MRAALWRSQRGAEPPRARSGEACGARGTGRSLRRGEAARRPTGTHRARPCSDRGGVVRGGIPPDFPPGAEASGPPSPRQAPALAQNRTFCGRSLKQVCGANLHKMWFCVGAGGRGRRGGWGPRRPRMASCSHLHRGSGPGGGAGATDGPRRKTGGALPVTARNPQAKRARVVVAIRAPISTLR